MIFNIQNMIFVDILNALLVLPNCNYWCIYCKNHKNNTNWSNKHCIRSWCYWKSLSMVVWMTRAKFGTFWAKKQRLIVKRSMRSILAYFWSKLAPAATRKAQKNFFFSRNLVWKCLESFPTNFGWKQAFEKMVKICHFFFLYGLSYTDV